MNTAHQKRHGISPRQIKAIHATVGKLGMDDDTYRAMLQERYRVASCKELTWRQAEELLESLNSGTRDQVSVKANASTNPRSPVPGPRQRKLRWQELDGRPGMCSGAQARMVEAMWAEVSRMTEAEARQQALWKFLQRIVGVSHFRFLGSYAVAVVVRAIQEMKKSGTRDQGLGTSKNSTTKGETE